MVKGEPNCWNPLMWTGGHMDWKSKSGCDDHNQKQESGSTGAVWTEVQKSEIPVQLELCGLKSKIWNTSPTGAGCRLKFQIWNTSPTESWMQTEVQNLKRPVQLKAGCRLKSKISNTSPTESWMQTEVQNLKYQSNWTESLNGNRLDSKLKSGNSD
jgi:hypothetical protein